MKLIKPNKKYLKSYYEACLESWNFTSNRYIIHNPNQFNEWKNTIFEEFNNNELGINLPEGFLPNITYWAVEGMEYIGTINIRPKLNDSLKNFGGHFGFFLRVSKRGINSSGNSLKLAKLAYSETKKLTQDKIIFVTCITTNKASYSILKKLGKTIKEELGTYTENGITYDTYKLWISD